MAGDVFGGIVRAGSSGAYTYSVKAGRANTPVTFVSWYDSLRFINWLHNGQGSGDTESGAYFLGGVAQASTAREADGKYFLPDENEFFNAAFHNAAAGTADDYFIYGTNSNTVPNDADPLVDPSGANYNQAVWDGTDTDNPFTDVGAYTAAASPYGTFDQNGNADEWVQSSLNAGEIARIRGGSALSSGSGNAFRSFYDISFPSSKTNEFNAVGFRVVTPEPSSAVLLALVSPLLVRRRRA